MDFIYVKAFFISGHMEHMMMVLYPDSEPIQNVCC